MKKNVHRAKEDPSPEPKHRSTIEFRGLTYRYDKAYGEWRLVDRRKAPITVLQTIRSTSERGWEADGYYADEPLGALEKWHAALVELRTKEADEALAQARELFEEATWLRGDNLMNERKQRAVPVKVAQLSGRERAGSRAKRQPRGAPPK